MTTRPKLPDDFDLPKEVNGWIYDAESNRNGHIWTAEDVPKSVGMFYTMGRAYVNIFDDRVVGYEAGQEWATLRVPDDERGTETELEKLADMAWEATHWMESHAPEDWTHPDVVEAVFSPPPGYELERYFLEQRDTVIWYRREDAEGGFRLAGVGEPESYTPETCPYLYVHVWNGSGNATVALAPWRGAHGPGSKHEEIHRVAEPPEECGLEVALKYAREYAQEVTGETRGAPAPGQSGLDDFDGGASA